jgi:hypothetical protein
MVYLPTELWLAVFEQLTAHDVHIFKQSGRYRLEEICKLQTLQLVCRQWRVQLFFKI